MTETARNATFSTKKKGKATPRQVVNQVLIFYHSSASCVLFDTRKVVDAEYVVLWSRGGRTPALIEGKKRPESARKTCHVFVRTGLCSFTVKKRWLDIDVNGHEVSVAVPLGVYASRQAYFSALQESGRDQHPKQLKYFGVKFDSAQPFVRNTMISFK